MTSSDRDWPLTPYARSLGIRYAEESTAQSRLLMVDFDVGVEGRPEHLHGGAISGLLETAAYVTLSKALLEEGREARMKPINLTVQFLTSGKRKASYAEARITKLGRRTANLTIEAWQDDRTRPIASAVMNVFLAEQSSDA